MGNAIASCRSPCVASPEEYLWVQYADGRTEFIEGPTALSRKPFVHQKITVHPYQRYVCDQKEYLRVQRLNGEVEHMHGPRELRLNPLIHRAIQVLPLTFHVADQNQYLDIQFLDGRREHRRGPVQLVFDGFRHAKVTVEAATRLAANEALVVYRKQNTAEQNQLVAKQEVLPAAAAKRVPNGRCVTAGMDSTALLVDAMPSTTPPLLTAEAAGREAAVVVERRIVHGPTVFMPDANEWIHTFSWHGSIVNGKGSKTGVPGDEKVPHALEFQKLRCMPDQMYYSVRDVRTSDDAHLTVSLMIFYELQQIETMLDSTNDPIGDFINAASADVMTFAAHTTYEAFLQQTAALSDLSTFPILRARMEQTGTRLLKVVYRGLAATAQLQEMHNAAIVKRTKLRLELDAAREEQEKQDMELRCKQERWARERELEEAAARHQAEMAALKMSAERRERDEEHAQTLRHAQALAQLEVETLRAKHDEDIRRTGALKGLDVDLTQYLCAMAASKPDQHLRIDAAPEQHLHVELPHRPKGV